MSSTVLTLAQGTSSEQRPRQVPHLGAYCTVRTVTLLPETEVPTTVLEQVQCNTALPVLYRNYLHLYSAVLLIRAQDHDSEHDQGGQDCAGRGHSGAVEEGHGGEREQQVSHRRVPPRCEEQRGLRERCEHLRVLLKGDVGKQ